MDENRMEEAYRCESEMKNYFLKLHLINLHPTNPDEFYEKKMKLIDDSEYEKSERRKIDREAGITWELKARARFKTDARNELSKRKEQADKEYEEFLNERCEKQNKYKKEVYELYEKMRRGDENEVTSYFAAALYQDQYRVNCCDNFDVEVGNIIFNNSCGLLEIAYRIPEAIDILTFKEFKYDQNIDKIIPVDIDEAYQYIQRISVLRKILVRVLEMIYFSDPDGLVQNIKLTGYLYYYDTSFGMKCRKNVISLEFSRQDFENTNFEKVNVNDMFEKRIKTKMSSGLYKKTPEEIRPI